MRILSASFVSPCVDAQEAFYRDVLGLHTERAPEGDALGVRAGHSWLAFHLSRGGDRTCYHFAFNIPSDRLPEAADWLRGRGVRLLAGPGGREEFTSASWAARMVYFEDPAGNVLEFIARDEIGPGAGGAPGPFGPGEIMGVSEVGVASRNVRLDCHGLAEKLPGLTPYKQNPDDEFVPLGDAEGLLIVVREGRPWFPTTDRRAHASPSAVTVKQGGATRVLNFGAAQHGAGAGEVARPAGG